MGASPEKAGRDEFVVRGVSLVVDSCFVYDAQCFETCVFRDDDGGTNVEHYDTMKQAIAGHKKWVRKLKKTPKMKLEERLIYVW